MAWELIRSYRLNLEKLENYLREQFPKTIIDIQVRSQRQPSTMFKEYPSADNIYENQLDTVR